MSVLWIDGSCPKFEITDEELARRMKMMRPAYLSEKGNLIYMVVPDPRKVAFTWEIAELQGADEWREVARIETHHRCGYIGMFKPSIAEVLAQVPAHILEEANAFVTLTGDSVACYDKGDGHRTVTIFYSASQIVADQNLFYETVGDFMNVQRTKQERSLP